MYDLDANWQFHICLMSMSLAFIPERQAGLKKPLRLTEFLWFNHKLTTWSSGIKSESRYNDILMFLLFFFNNESSWHSWCEQKWLVASCCFFELYEKVDRYNNWNHTVSDSDINIYIYIPSANLYTCWHTHRHRKGGVCPTPVCPRWDRSVCCCHEGCIRGCRSTRQTCWHNGRRPGFYSHSWGLRVPRSESGQNL